MPFICSLTHFDASKILISHYPSFSLGTPFRKWSYELYPSSLHCRQGLRRVLTYPNLYGHLRQGGMICLIFFISCSPLILTKNNYTAGHLPLYIGFLKQFEGPYNIIILRVIDILCLSEKIMTNYPSYPSGYLISTIGLSLGLVIFVFIISL